MVNKSYFTSQDASYSRTNVFPKTNVLIDFPRLPSTENIASTGNTLWQLQFARTHTSSLINIEKILNRLITKFYNSDDVYVTAAELRYTKTWPSSFYKEA